MDDTRTPPPRTGNGPTAAEKRLYAVAANAAVPRAVQVTKAANMRQARRAKIAAEIDPDGTLTPAELEREVGRFIRGQLAKATAASLTARRKAKEAAQRAAEAEKAEAAVRRELA
jgi:hypothetical protein